MIKHESNGNFFLWKAQTRLDASFGPVFSLWTCYPFPTLPALSRYVTLTCQRRDRVEPVYFKFYYTSNPIISDDVNNFLFGATVVIRKFVLHPFFLKLVFGKHTSFFSFFLFFPLAVLAMHTGSKCQYLNFSCSSFIFIFTNTKSSCLVTLLPPPWQWRGAVKTSATRCEMGTNDDWLGNVHWHIIYHLFFQVLLLKHLLFRFLSCLVTQPLNHPATATTMTWRWKNHARWLCSEYHRLNTLVGQPSLVMWEGCLVMGMAHCPLTFGSLNLTTRIKVLLSRICRLRRQPSLVLPN